MAPRLCRTGHLTRDRTFSAALRCLPLHFVAFGYPSHTELLKKYDGRRCTTPPISIFLRFYHGIQRIASGLCAGCWETKRCHVVSEGSAEFLTLHNHNEGLRPRRHAVQLMHRTRGWPTAATSGCRNFGSNHCRVFSTCRVLSAPQIWGSYAALMHCARSIRLPACLCWNRMMRHNHCDGPLARRRNRGALSHNRQKGFI